MDANNKNNDKNKSNEKYDYAVCPVCNKKYPDYIIEKIETFKFKLTFQCPYCKSYHVLGEF